MCIMCHNMSGSVLLLNLLLERKIDILTLKKCTWTKDLVLILIVSLIFKIDILVCVSVKFNMFADKLSFHDIKHEIYMFFRN